jgi:hypothetical protein
VHAETPPPAPPFAALKPVLLTVAAYAGAALVWLAAGGGLPGGRWFGVHLLTVGVVSNLIAALTVHFAQTILHTRDRGLHAPRLILLNAGAVGLLVGLAGGWRVLFAAGATALTAAVLWLYVDLRRMRKASLTGRFAFVVRGYERACGAFIHGALLGLLLGLGVFGGTWYASARLAHLHVNILGWGGLTLLATVVFFGPTVMRTRMVEHADRVAVPALRHGATGLTIGVVGLLVTGAQGPVGMGARVVAVAGLAVFATAATAVLRTVLQAARTARPTPHAAHLAAASVWFVLAVWADVGVIATGRTRLLDAVGVAFLVGVLGQAILGSLGYLLPMVWGSGQGQRAQIREDLDRLARTRLMLVNLGVGAIATGAAWTGAPASPLLVRGGWLLVGAAVGVQVALSILAGLRARRTHRPVTGQRLIA